MPRNTPPTLSLSVRVTPDLHTRLKRAAQDESNSAASVIRRLLNQNLPRAEATDAHEKKPDPGR
jgi:predicted transcriptional regulator